ncbi:MAG: DUF5715 family protein [Gemmatimonadota bacterium]
MRSTISTFLGLVALFPALIAAEGAESLRGSRASMLRQHEVAEEQDYSFLRTPKQVEKSVEEGRLVALEGNEDYQVIGAKYPYALPEVKLFVEQLASEYRQACDERLVVTSLTRPVTKQPRNAHPLSVHPAGMAVDLRISTNALCRDWLSQSLLALEADDLLDVTREQRPPHFHVAIFPAAYREHVMEQLEAEAMARAKSAAETPVQPVIVQAGVHPGFAAGDWSFAAAVTSFIVAGALLYRRRGQPRLLKRAHRK